MQADIIDLVIFFAKIFYVDFFNSQRVVHSSIISYSLLVSKDFLPLPSHFFVIMHVFVTGYWTGV